MSRDRQTLLLLGLPSYRWHMRHWELRLRIPRSREMVLSWSLQKATKWGILNVNHNLPFLEMVDNNASDSFFQNFVKLSYTNWSILVRKAIFKFIDWIIKKIISPFKSIFILLILLNVVTKYFQIRIHKNIYNNSLHFELTL